MKTRDKADDIVNGRTFYVEARIGSENHRNKRDGDPCRAVFRGGSSNDAADELIRELAEAYLRLHEAAFDGFSALVGSHARDDSVQGMARARLRSVLGIGEPA